MSGIPWETVTLTTLSRDRGVFPRLLAEARDMAMRGNEGKLVIHTPWGIEWRPFGLPRRKRPLRSVVLQEGVAERIDEDVTAFLRRRQWYADRGECRRLWCITVVLTLSRHPISSGLSAARSSRLGEVVVHPSSCRLTVIRHLSTESVGTGSSRRQAHTPSVQHTRAKHCADRRHRRRV